MLTALVFCIPPELLLSETDFFSVIDVVVLTDLLALLILADYRLIDYLTDLIVVLDRYILRMSMLLFASCVCRLGCTDGGDDAVSEVVVVCC